MAVNNRPFFIDQQSNVQYYSIILRFVLFATALSFHWLDYQR